MEEITSLRQTEEELNRMLDSVSLGGLSLDSGHGSDVSSLASWRSTLSLNPQGATGGQREARGLLKSIKKRLTLGKSKTIVEKVIVEKEVPIYMYALYNEDKTAFITLQCRQQEMDRERTNIEWCHVTIDGGLVNTKPNSGIQQGMRSFKKYCGTCSTSPIYLPPSQSFLISVPPAPHYWETETAVGMKRENRWRPVMEIGVTEENMIDSGIMVHDTHRSWCVTVGGCYTHKGHCSQVWNQGYVKCVTDTISNTPGTSYTLRYGVVVDIVRGRVGFVDVDKGVVLEKIDVEFRQTIYPVFGVCPDQDDFTVEMKLISGSDVTMTEAKQKLIYSSLT